MFPREGDTTVAKHIVLAVIVDWLDFSFHVQKLFYVPAGNAITSHQAFCIPTIKPVRRETALLLRQKSSPSLHKESLITHRAILAALVSRCWLHSRLWPMRDEHMGALEAYEALVIAQF